MQTFYNYNFFRKKAIPFPLLILAFFSVQLSAQTILTGNVTDSADGEALIGATIVAEGTTTGTVTDLAGDFSLDIPNGTEAVVISYTGYESQRIVLDGRSNINVALEQSSIGLEEITVTARKAIENVQEVPLAVAAFSLKMLEDRGVGNVGQLADYVPNVEIDVSTAFGGSQSLLSPFIRGIGQNDFAITFEPAVGLYVDGVYYGRGVGSVIDMLDVERIEVLKGPQGTLFGRNTIAGAINVTTVQPDSEFGVQAQVNTGSYNRMDTRISINAPIIEDKLLSTFSMATNDRDGFVQRIPFPGELSPLDRSVQNTVANGTYSTVGNGNDQGNFNNQTLRGKLFLDASENFKVTLVADYVRIRENESAGTQIAVDASDPSNLVSTYNLGTIINAENEEAILGSIPTPSGLPPFLEPVFYQLLFNFSEINGFDNAYPLLGRTPFDDRFVTGDPFTNYATADAGSRIDVWGGALTFDWDLSESIAFKSISSIRSLRSQFAQDGDYSPLDWSVLKLTMPQDQFTQEFQFVGSSDKLNWTAGLYHFQEDGSILDEVYFGAGLIQVFGLNEVRNKTYAAYAQGSYKLNNQLSITAGARFTNEQKKLNGQQRDLNCYGCLVTPPDAFPTSDPTRYFPPGPNDGFHEQSFNEPTFRFGAEYRISDDIFAYASFAQGFKSGGWTTRLTSPSLTAPAFNPETSNTYEIGVKSEFLANKLRLNLTYFNTAYNEMQVTVFRGVSPTVINAAEAAISGIEADLQWRLSDNVLFVGNLGILDAGYASFDRERLEAEGFVLRVNEDSKLLNAADLSFGLGIDIVNTQDFDKGKIGLHIDYNYRSDIANDVENTPMLIQDGFGLLNSYVFFEPAGRKYKLTLGGTNLTDTRYITTGTFNPAVGNAYATYGRPVEWSAGISFKL